MNLDRSTRDLLQKILSTSLKVFLVSFASLYVVKNKHQITGHALFCYLFKSDTRAPPLVDSGYIANLRAVVSKDFPSILLNWSRKFGPIFQMKFPYPQIHQPMLVISGDLELHREVLNDRRSIKTGLYDVYKFIHDGGEDLFTSEGEYWVHSRKNIAPAFSSYHIKRMNEVVERETKKCMEKLKKYADEGQAFDVGLEMINLTLSTIFDAAFQYDISTEEKELLLNELNIALREVEWGRVPFRWRFGTWIPTVVRAREASQKLLVIGQNILDSYRSLDAPVKGTVIDLIANNPKYKDDKERVSDIILLVFGGHDTTAYTIAWTLIVLAKYPEEQAKLQKELQSMAPANRKHSQTLKCIINESMRFQTVVPMGSPRIVRRDIKILKNEKNGLQHDIVIPKYSLVLCSQLLLNYNTKYFKDPHLFQPSRWIDPTDEELAALMPFSLGRRNCIGQSLAKIEIVNVLANICADYSFEILDEGTVDLVVTRRPVKAMLIPKLRNM